MNKAGLYIICILILMPFVMADEVYISKVKFYVNDERESGIDEDGGTINAERNDLVEAVISIENKLLNDTEVRLLMIINDIDDGDDIEREIDWFDVKAEDDKSKTLSFFVPDDTEYDTFDIELEFYWRNGTDHEETIDYELDINKPREVVDEGPSIEELYINQTSAMFSRIDSCFGYINDSREIGSELSTCSEERGTCLSDKDDLKRDYDNIKGEYDTYKSDMSSDIDTLKEEIRQKDTEILQLNSRVRTMLTSQQCNNITSVKVNEVRSDNSNMLMWIGVFGVGGFFFYKKRKKESTVGDAMYEEM